MTAPGDLLAVDLDNGDQLQVERLDITTTAWQLSAPDGYIVYCGPHAAGVLRAVEDYCRRNQTNIIEIQ